MESTEGEVGIDDTGEQEKKGVRNDFNSGWYLISFAVIFWVFQTCTIN